VCHHYPIVGGGAPPFAHVVELRILADRFIAEEQPRGHVRMRCDQALDEWHGGIAGGGCAEDDFVARIIELEGRPERILDVIFQPADWPYHTDAGDVGRRSRSPSLATGAASGSPQKPRQPQEPQRGLRLRTTRIFCGFPATLRRDRDAADMGDACSDAVRPDGPNRNRHAAASSRWP